MVAERRIIPVILAGGVGARLAPISTESRPKPFVPLADGSSLLARSCARVAHRSFAAPVIVGRAPDRFALLNHARDGGVVPAAILLESAMRNTAWAAALAVAWLRRENNETMLALLPADHWIAPVMGWQTALRNAADVARRSGKLCLLAVHPTTPDAAYGYMQLAPRGAWQEVTRFIEKPARPEKLLSDGGWAWNSGQFVGSCGLFAGLFEQFAPDLWTLAQKAVHAAKTEWEFTLLPPEHLPERAASFDRVILEKASCVAVPLGAEWRDLGSVTAWEAHTGLPVAHYGAFPQRTDRPWGYFELHASEASRVEKRLTIYPGCRLSRQRHYRRDEEWHVVRGVARIELDGDFRSLAAGEKLRIPAGCWHRLANHGGDLLIIDEIQSGSPDENDIERSDDDYGRA